MTWGNPWAWLGLGAIAVPMLIHLLARQASKPVPFPTLRFLRATPLVDVRRRRLTDLLLLAIRIGVIALAVAALAQPFASRAASPLEHRLVIVDTSASVEASAAEAAAGSYTGATGSVTRIERRDLRGAMREARAWARALPGTSTVVVISDFQRGTIDEAALAQLPAPLGVRLHRVPMRDRGALDVPGVQHVAIDGGRTSATWSATWSATAGAAPGEIRIESGHDAATNDAIVGTALATAPPRQGALRPVLFVLPESPRRAELLASSQEAIAPWMFDVFAAITRARATTVRASDGVAIVFLAVDDAAAAADAIREAIPAMGGDVAELEPSALSDGELRQLERDATLAAPRGSAGAWIGRWFWIAALLLLGIEALVRRARRPVVEEVRRAA